LVGGLPESASSYLNYCKAKCKWNKELYKPISSEEKMTALNILLNHPRFKKPLIEQDRTFLEDQF
jgi:hypothetical protein